MDHTSRVFEKSGRVDATKANFTFVKPNASTSAGAGLSRIAANDKVIFMP